MCFRRRSKAQLRACPCNESINISEVDLRNEEVDFSLEWQQAFPNSVEENGEGVKLMTSALEYKSWPWQNKDLMTPLFDCSKTSE